MWTCLIGCQHREVRLHTDAVVDRRYVPVLEADSVTTLISDSGVTRYRIQAAKWLIYDKADTPYWEFPQGVYLEKFDPYLHIDASLRADYAYYNEQAQSWFLKGNVHAMNLEGEQFDSPEMHWQQESQSIWSDSSIVITKKNTIIYGVGFRSNQNMSHYTILQPTGVFPIEE